MPPLLCPADQLSNRLVPPAQLQELPDRNWLWTSNGFLLLRSTSALHSRCQRCNYGSTVHCQVWSHSGALKLANVLHHEQAELNSRADPRAHNLPIRTLQAARFGAALYQHSRAVQ